MLFVAMVVPDEATDVDVGESGHQVLTVKAVHDPTMTWDGVGKVLQREATSHHLNSCTTQ